MKIVRFLNLLLVAVILAACSKQMTVESYFLEKISKDDLSKIVGDFRAEQLSNMTSDDFIHIKITVSHDLIRLTQKEGYSFNSNVRFCNDTSGHFRLNVPGVSSQGRSLLEWGFQEPGANHPLYRSKEPEYNYDILLFIALEEDTFAKPFMTNSEHSGHDLRTSTDDICVKLMGGLMRDSIVSNEFRLESAEIIEALK